MEISTTLDLEGSGVVVASGYLNTEGARLVSDAVGDLVARGATRVEISLHETHLVNGRGLLELNRLLENSTHPPSGLVVRGARPAVRKILEVLTPPFLAAASAA